MSILSDLQQRKANVAAELRAMNATAAGGKPDAGKSGIQHVAYRLSLLAELKELNDAINQEQINSQQDAGGYEFLTIGQ